MVKLRLLTGLLLQHHSSRYCYCIFARTGHRTTDKPGLIDWLQKGNNNMPCTILSLCTSEIFPPTAIWNIFGGNQKSKMPALGNWEVFDGNSWLSVKQSGTAEGRDPRLIGKSYWFRQLPVFGCNLRSAPISEDSDDDNKWYWLHFYDQIRSVDQQFFPSEFSHFIFFSFCQC